MNRVSSPFATSPDALRCTRTWSGRSVGAIIRRFLGRLFGRFSGRRFERRRQPRGRIGRFSRTSRRHRGRGAWRTGAARRRNLDGHRQRHHGSKPDAKIRSRERHEHRRSKHERSAQPRQPAGYDHSAGQTAPGTYSAGGTPAPSGTTTPSGTPYPSGEALEGARQRALQSPSGTAVPPAATGLGTDSSGNATTEQGTPGLPNTADPNRGSASTSGDPNRLAGGGRANREGASGANMKDCEAAWDEGTHMSKDKWRETCRRTLTDPHL